MFTWIQSMLHDGKPGEEAFLERDALRRKKQVFSGGESKPDLEFPAQGLFDIGPENPGLVLQSTGEPAHGRGVEQAEASVVGGEIDQKRGAGAQPRLQVLNRPLDLAAWKE
jgi:hypothetical protein